MSSLSGSGHSCPEMLFNAQTASTRTVSIQVFLEFTWQSHPAPPNSSSCSTRSVLINPGLTDLTIAATPDMIGVDMDVPDHTPYRPPGRALTIFSPGATNLTQRALPLLALAIVENGASRSYRVLAPTLNILSSDAIRSAAG
jgi:hypothetical protein